jgi:hypothetical protein
MCKPYNIFTKVDSGDARSEANATPSWKDTPNRT